MGASTMVNKILLWVTCCIVAILIGAVVLQMRRCRTCERIAESQTMPAAEIATASSEMPLTEAEIMECSHAVEAIANACSNRLACVYAESCLEVP